VAEEVVEMEKVEEAVELVVEEMVLVILQQIMLDQEQLTLVVVVVVEATLELQAVAEL
jgi:hypothetical protein